MQRIDGKGPLLVSAFATGCIGSTNHGGRTRAGIKKARKQGVEWGVNGKALAARNQNDAKLFAESLRPAMVDIISDGPRSTTAVARELNKKGIPTFRGGKWHPTTVRRLFNRLGPSLWEEVKAASIPKIEKKIAQMKAGNPQLPKPHE